MTRFNSFNPEINPNTNRSETERPVAISQSGDSAEDPEMAVFQSKVRGRTWHAIAGAVALAVGAGYGAYQLGSSTLNSTNSTPTEPAALLPSADSNDPETTVVSAKLQKPEESDAERAEKIFLERCKNMLSDNQLWEKDGGLHVTSYPFHLLKAAAHLSKQPDLDAATRVRLDEIFGRFLERLVYTIPQDFEKKFPDAQAHSILQSSRGKNIDEAFQLLEESYPFWKDRIPNAREIIAAYKAIHHREIRK